MMPFARALFPLMAAKMGIGQEKVNSADKGSAANSAAH